MGYVLIVAISIGVGVLVYRLTAGMTTVEHDPAMWAGAAPEAEPQAPPRPPRTSSACRSPTIASRGTIGSSGASGWRSRSRSARPLSRSRSTSRGRP